MTDLHALASRYNSIAVHLSRRLRRTDAESRVGPARLSALSVLVFGGAHTLSELAADEQVSLPTMSRVVSGLQAGGLADRRKDREDRRAVTIEATLRGRQLMEAARQRRIEQLAVRLARLSTAEIDGLAAAADILEKLETIDDA